MPDKLTDIQIRACQVPVGMIVVSAGAGTGKTKVLSETVAVEMVGRKKVDIRDIVVLTFTVKAAGEMAERIEGRLKQLAAETDDDFERTWLLENAGHAGEAHIETIDAFSQRILRDHPNETGIDPSFDVLEPNREMELAGTVARECFMRWRNKPPHQLWDVTAKGLNVQEWEDHFFRLASHIGTRQSMNLPGLLNGKVVGDETDPVKIANELKRRAEENLMIALDNVRELAGSLDELIPAAVEQSERKNGKYGEKALAIQEDVPDLKTWLNQKELDWGHEIVGRVSGWTLLGSVGGDAKPAAVAIKELRSQIGGLGDTDTPKCELLKFVDLERRLVDNKIALAYALLDFHKAFRDERFRQMTLSFSDCEVEALNLLTRNPAVRKFYNEKFRYVVVDEFQDINPLQKELIFALCRGDGDSVENLYVVGDERQSIYGFRDADYRLLRDLRRKLDGISDEGKGSRVLHENFRSRVEILDFVNHIFRKVWIDGSSVEHTDLTPPVDNPAHRSGSKGCCIELHLVIEENVKDARKAEARVIASRIADIVRNCEVKISETDKSGAATTRPVQWGDCAVLLRKKGPFTHYEEVFTEFGIPYLTESGGGFWDTQEVGDALALLMCLSVAPENLDWAVLLRSPWVGISDDGLYEISRVVDKSCWNKIPVDLKFRHDTDNRRFAKFREWFDKLREKAGRAPVGTLFSEAWDISRYAERVMVQDRGRNIRANIEKLTGILMSEGEQFDPGKAVEFMRWLRSQDTTDAQALFAPLGMSGAVTLATVHQAKGREWPVVVVADLGGKPGGRNQSQIIWDENTGLAFRWLNPTTGETETPSGLLSASENAKAREEAENERVLYVALTRPRDYLILSSGVKIPKKEDADKFTYDKNSWLGQLYSVFEVDGINLTGAPADIDNGHCELKFRTKSIVGKTEIEKDIVINRNYHTTLPPNPEIEKEEKRIASTDLINRLKEIPILPTGSSERYLVTATEVMQFEKCPRMYAYRAIWNVPSIDIAPVQREDDEVRESKIELPASEWGTFLHRIMEKVSYNASDCEIAEIVSITLSEYVDLSPELRSSAFDIVKKTLALSIFDTIRNCPGDKIRREFRLLGKIDNAGPAILGTIDLLAECPDKIILVDYKSGKVSRGEVEKTADRYKIQLGLYSLLAASRTGANPESIEPLIIFISEGLDIPIKYSKGDFVAVRDTLNKLVERSRANQFDATPSEITCRWCDYKNICIFSQR